MPPIAVGRGGVPACVLENRLPYWVRAMVRLAETRKIRFFLRSTWKSIDGSTLS